MSVRLRQVSALEAVLVAAAPRPSSNEDSPPAAGLWLGGLRRSFVTCPTHLSDIGVSQTILSPDPANGIVTRESAALIVRAFVLTSRLRNDCSRGRNA